MLSNHEILCLSNMHWDGHMTCKQQIMLRLSKQNKVLYVNRPLTFLSPLSGNEEISPWRQFSEIGSKPREVRPNLFVATPPLMLPLRHLQLSYMTNSQILVMWLHKTMYKLGLHSPIIWSYLPELARVVKSLPKKMSLYHCVDEHSAWGNWWNSARNIRKREIEMLRNADLVIATSQNLQQKKVEISRHCHFIPNAADLDLFSRATHPETQVPSDLAALPKPVIGYVGILGPNHIDIDWVEFAAKKSGYTFVFVGRKYPETFDLSRLERCKNVYFFGFIEPAQLPCYLKGMEVCIMPYVKSERTDATFPLKLFEYLAAGKPVVSTRTDELVPYAHLISLVDTPEEFLEAINLAHHDDSHEKTKARVEAAKANTWDVRVEDISKLVEETLERKQKQ